MLCADYLEVLSGVLYVLDKFDIKLSVVLLLKDAVGKNFTMCDQMPPSVKT